MSSLKLSYLRVNALWCRDEVIKGFGLLSLLRGRAYGEDNYMSQVRTDDDEDKAEEALQAARPLDGHTTMLRPLLVLQPGVCALRLLELHGWDG